MSILSLQPLAWLAHSLQPLVSLADLLLGWLAAILFWYFDIGLVRVFSAIRISILVFHNANAIVNQMMAHLQVNEDKHVATGTQHATALASANQANAMMESQMPNIFAHVHALQLANTPKHGSNYSHGRGRGRGASRGPWRSQPLAPHTSKYCWIHGNCNHGSKE